MEKFYESEFMTIYYDSEKKLAKTVRNKATEDYSNELYKVDILEWRKAIDSHTIIGQLVDERDFKFTIEPDLQVWVNQNLIGPAVKQGLKKVAFVVSSDIFAQISIEQAMNESESLPLDIQYFDNEIDAENWLLE